MRKNVPLKKLKNFQGTIDRTNVPVYNESVKSACFRGRKNAAVIRIKRMRKDKETDP